MFLVRIIAVVGNLGKGRRRNSNLRRGQYSVHRIPLALMVRDVHRRRVLPGVSWFRESPFGPGPQEWWIRLPPGYLYGRDVTLTKYESAFMTMPGKYEIAVSYTGINRPDPGSKPPRGPTNVPLKGSNIFTGHIESNSISIEILAPAAKKP